MKSSAESVFPWLVYPGTISLVLVLHLSLMQSAQPLLLSGYLPVLIGAALVMFLEWRMPARDTWRPTALDVRNDVLYMLVVQIALPKLLGLAIVLWVLDASHANPTDLWSLWPHDWPIGLQVVTMILVADFFRYWLHRAAHETELLWRFHAVHHSPIRLYWLNVGRFHPVDKMLQFLLDSLPFIVMGVSAEVVTLYFVFYAVNGFFQHSNIRLHFGWLNYVISSAELHRWHHSRKVKESNTNYGNNIIVWDLLFGTWFLPRHDTVGGLGLINRAYPLDFWQQLRAPFTPDVLYRDVPLQGLRRVFARWLAWLVMKWVATFEFTRLRWAARDPQGTQDRVLRNIVRANMKTHFAADFGFERVTRYEDFVSAVPVQEYEKLRPYIFEQEVGNGAALTQDMPFMYAVTSGTTGEPKYLPVLYSTLEAYRKEQRLQAYLQYRYCPMAFTGKLFGISGPAVEGHRQSGLPFGSISGQLYASIPRLMQVNNVLPPTVYDIADASIKYQVMMCFALAESQITHMIGANPSSFLRLLDVLNQTRDVIADCVERGSLAGIEGIEDELVLRLDPHLRSDPDRAQLLRDVSPGCELCYAALWPEIRLLSVWTGGSCGVALATLKGRLPGFTKIMELGYLASELRGSITVDAHTGAGVLTLQHHFFEFIEPDEWESGGRVFRRLHELQQGVDYYVVVTTGAGLYRYFMNDIVQVVGMFEATPTIRFMQKGRGVTSITGEKVYESQLLQAVTEVIQASAITPVFVMALADEGTSIYRIYAEVEGDMERAGMSTPLAEKIDAALSIINMEYSAKRDSGRLAPLQFNWLKAGAGEAYRQYCLEQGQHEGQFKTVALQYQSKFGFSFEPYITG